MIFGEKTIELLLLYAVLAIMAILIIWLVRIEWRLKKFFRGKNAKTLEGSMDAIQKDLDWLMTKYGKSEKIIAEMNRKLARSIQGLGVIRFNPFKGTSGSNQSFSVAFLDEEKNGAVISSIYSRERVSVFAKPLQSGKSEYELSPEEKEAINRASDSGNSEL